MTKQETIDEQAVAQFNQTLDAFITGQTPVADRQNAPDADLFAIARLLATADVAKLRQQRPRPWSQVVQQRQQARLRRRLSYGMAAAIFVAGFFLLLTTTPLQAWAQAVLARFGGFTISSDPEWTAEQLEALKTDTATPEAPIPPSLSQQEASRIAGFPVLLPTYIPSDLTLVATNVFTEANGAYVSTAYVGRGVLSIMQWKLPPEGKHNMRIGDAAMKPVMVRGYQGYGIEDAGLGAVSDDITIRPSNDNLLVWEENGIVFQIVSGGGNTSDFQALPIAELLKIAESLKP